ncbi:hypothetical protein GDO86_015338 [Hymenochirus boettgeri]|uniref:Lysosome-associated membrane glycoprotein 2 n=1 Tax=Hymenochirus boettgeri TaxID=247094 RepID=A0A8T2JXH1_9PIPI|nr:hypothetical protein GDO86_015338 [Hymenochirus boettgeri]
MERPVCLTGLCLLSLAVLMVTTAFEVEIKDDKNATCIYASLLISLTIQYDTNNGSLKNTTLQIPNNVTTDGSDCGSNTSAPLLVINFGSGHSWSLNFTKNETMYSGNVLTVTYNTSDLSLFPDALGKGLVNSTATFLKSIPINRTYKCISSEIVVGEKVSQIISNVTLQAFVQNGTLGEAVICNADKPTPAPSTTTAPSSPNTTFPTPTPTSKPLDKPSTGNYFVSDSRGKCLLASMGLQINVSLLSEGKKMWIPFNIDPNVTQSTGSCSNQTATLRITENRTVIEFLFAIKNKNHFHLQEVNITLSNGSGSFSIQNQNLSFWEASIGSSYMCHKEQDLQVSDDLYINTYDVRVQPFGVNNGTYATAQQCSLDDDSIIIPIVVGAALSGLIIIIVIAYLIGRRKGYAGYQTL